MDNDQATRLAEALEKRGLAEGKRWGWRWGSLSSQLYMMWIFLGARALFPLHWWTRLLHWERYVVGAMALGCFVAWVWIYWRKRP